MKTTQSVAAIVSAIFLILAAGVGSATIIYVDDDNTSGPWDGTAGHPYQYIQNGVEGANNGDTVYVLNGVYYENVTVDRLVVLTGESRDNTVIDGGGSGNTIRVAADSVNISRLTIRNGYTGIRITSGYTAVSSNKIENNTSVGIHVDSNIGSSIIHNVITGSELGVVVYASWGNVIGENTVTDNGLGIVLNYGANNTVSDNLMIDNSDTGLHLGEVSNSTITGNVIRSNGGDGIHLAHLLYFQPYNNTISGNNIEDNEGHGIFLYLTHDNVISWNYITGNNGIGINSFDVDSCSIFNNHVANNNEIGVYLDAESDGNALHHNNLIGHDENAHDEGTNIWDDGYPSGGNYWDDYTGSDDFSGPEQNIPGSDGIGDTPHDIPGGSNHDGYPLMAAYSVLFVRGDANADMKIQMGDATNILLYLYVPGSPALVCMDAGDANDDGAITMNDALYILHYLYVPGSPEPQAPFPGCGMDQTEDELVCLSYPPCE